MPVLAVRPRSDVTRGTGDRPWWRRHFAFGGRGLLAAVWSNSSAHRRGDAELLCLGPRHRRLRLCSLFAEGVFQLPVVLRTVAYPTIVQLAARADRSGVARMARRLSLASGALSS